MIFVVKKKHVLCVGLALVLIICLLQLTPTGMQHISSSATSDWGLSYNTPNSIPAGNLTADELAGYNAFYVGDTSAKTIYLTFDAGYENGNTEKILSALKKHNAPATFFLVSNYLKTSPALVKKMLAEGHTIGNHTYSHPDMSKISTEDAFKKELEAMETLYKDITGQEMKKLYRPPQGKFNTVNLSMAKSLGYKTFFWSLAYVDWLENKQPSPDYAFKKLIPRIHNGAIVLLHSTSATNADILDELLTKWEELGYTFGSLCDLGV